MANVTPKVPAIATCTLNDILTAGTLNISPVAWQQIDPSLWFTPVSDNPTEVHITTWVARQLQDYTYGNLIRDDLFFAFQEDFASWAETNFDKINQPFKRELKLLLRKRGIYTGKNNGPIGRQLANLLKIESCPEWPVDERCPNPHQRFSRGKAEAKQEDTEVLLQGTSFLDSNGSQQKEKLQGSVTSNLSKNKQPPRQSQVGTSTMLQNPYITLPPEPTINEDLDPHVLTQFAKLWDKGKMYTGEPYDILDDKLRIFLNICKFLKIRPGQFHAALPRILKGRAETYYLHFIGPEASFALAYMKLKAHFDTEINHNTYYTDWTTTTFPKVRQENSENSLQEVLQILIDKLELCQRALGPNYTGEEVLRTAVIMACRGVPELKNALFKPAKYCEELYSDLRSSIETFERYPSTPIYDR
ncbi:hypothetical protein K3495_g14301 [Podosphaera aphanis]|nr:hypothetical protein K3495_g14301 [Podosphaera aphanis]